jgi:hypothetical protein
LYWVWVFVIDFCMTLFLCIYNREEERKCNSKSRWSHKWRRAMSKRSKKQIPVLGFSEDSESEGEGQLRTYSPCGFSFSIFFLLVVFSWIAIEFCQRLLHDSFLCITLLHQRKTGNAIADPNDRMSGREPWAKLQNTFLFSGFLKTQGAR